MDPESISQNQATADAIDHVLATEVAVQTPEPAPPQAAVDVTTNGSGERTAVVQGQARPAFSTIGDWTNFPQQARDIEAVLTSVASDLWTDSVRRRGSRLGRLRMVPQPGIWMCQHSRESLDMGRDGVERLTNSLARMVDQAVGLFYAYHGAQVSVEYNELMRAIVVRLQCNHQYEVLPDPEDASPNISWVSQEDYEAARRAGSTPRAARDVDNLNDRMNAGLSSMWLTALDRMNVTLHDCEATRLDTPVTSFSRRLFNQFVNNSVTQFAMSMLQTMVNEAASALLSGDGASVHCSVQREGVSGEITVSIDLVCVVRYVRREAATQPPEPSPIPNNYGPSPLRESFTARYDRHNDERGGGLHRHASGDISQTAEHWAEMIVRADHLHSFTYGHVGGGRCRHCGMTRQSYTSLLNESGPLSVQFCYHARELTWPRLRVRTFTETINEAADQLRNATGLEAINVGWSDPPPTLNVREAVRRIAEMYSSGAALAVPSGEAASRPPAAQPNQPLRIAHTRARLVVTGENKTS